MPDLPLLATTTDYEARFGPIPNERIQPLSNLLADASSRAREIAGLSISRVDDDVVTVVQPGAGVRLLLPVFPVIEVTAVEVDGTPVADLEATVRSWPWGALDHLSGWWAGGQVVTVTVTHGHDPVPDWIKGAVCQAVRRTQSTPGGEGATSQAVGGQSWGYPAALAIGGIWYPTSDEERLRALRGPIVR